MVQAAVIRRRGTARIVIVTNARYLIKNARKDRRRKATATGNLDK